MNKRGISTVVATVLIVLITVAAVTILWAGISPLIDQDLSGQTGCFSAQGAIEIDTTDQTYTCRANDTNGDYKFRLKRGNDNINLRGAEVYVEIDGTTQTAYSVTADKIPDANKLKAYPNPDPVNSMDGATTVTISVAPKILIDGAETACEKSAPVVLNICA